MRHPTQLLQLPIMALHKVRAMGHFLKNRIRSLQQLTNSLMRLSLLFLGHQGSNSLHNTRLLNSFNHHNPFHLDFSSLDMHFQEDHLNLSELGRLHLDLSTRMQDHLRIVHPHKAIYPLAHRAYHLLQVFPKDHHSALLRFLRIRCSSCIKVSQLPSKASKMAGKVVDGRDKTRNQLCHQLTLLMLKVMVTLRLTLLLWTT